MKNLFFLLSFCCMCLATKAQTAASYGFSRSTGTYTSIAGAPGTIVTTAFSADEAIQTSIPIGFIFVYCGTSYTMLSACSNGWLSLANSSSSTAYSNSTAEIYGPGFLMPNWDDLNGTGDTAYYQTSGVAPNRIFTIQWGDPAGSMWSTYAGSGAATWQVKLYETTGEIQFVYGASTFSGNSATIGISNSSTDWQTLASSGATTTSSTTFTTSLGTTPLAGSILTWVSTNSITGPATLCEGSSIALSDTASGGTWSSGSPGIATIGSGTGIVTGIAAGTTTITYTTGSSSATRVITVNASPTASAVTPAMCIGGFTSLTASPAGGTWSSSNPAVATVLVSGLSSVSAGTANITYTLSTGCYSFFVITVNATTPAAITGPGIVCSGSTVTMSDATPGGTWSCSPGATATIGVTGILSGVAAGTAMVTYDVAGCAVTTTILVIGLQIPQICAVTVDSASGKNLVVWNQFTPNHIEQFNIYRENSSSVFVKIDSQASNVFSTYLDTGSYPVLQSYSYQLTAIDSCGSETPLGSSTIHITVHVSANVGVGGVVNLIWNTYVGAAVTTQNIMRSVGGAPYVNIASVANTVTSYTDPTPPSGTLLYEINSVMASACSPSVRVTSGGYSVSSNVARIVSTTGINMPTLDPSVQVFPNPATDELTIVMENDAYNSFTIANCLGQQMIHQQINSPQTAVNIKSLPAGVYYITLRGENGTKEQKFVKL